MLFNFGKLHRLWGLLSLIISVPFIALYFIASDRAGKWLGGASIPGLWCGSIAGAIILFEMLLWPRKILRAWRLVPTKYWMAAHIWLGLASVPLAILHCGFHLGGTLATLLMSFFAVTIVSGVYGLVMQNTIPKWMRTHLPSETIHSQIDQVSFRFIAEIEDLITKKCGAQLAGVNDNAGTGDASELWGALDGIRDILLHGAKAKNKENVAQLAIRFDSVRTSVSPEFRFIVDEMQDRCERRFQFDTQKKLHWWLHSWIPLHLGLSIVLTSLLVVHVLTAIKYW
ncbi:MAG: hypothetical protein KDB27_06220 [Planctomycetales bacterium]|nr:hypothetical protein [Planctomycetales bacterium]